MNAEPRSRSSASEISPEREFLLCAARAQIDRGAKGRARALANQGLNWGEVVAVATAQHMSSALFDSLAEEQKLDLLGPAKPIVMAAVRKSAQSALRLTAELVRLYQLFEAAGVQVIPYKGPVLALLAYGNLGKREFVDLDFALQQRFVPLAVETLGAARYRARFDLREAHAGERAFAPGQYLFESRDRAVMVELHTERTLRYFPTPLDFQDLESRLIRIEVGGKCLRTFSVEDTLLMLCVHGAKHFWDRLAWIFDVAKLMTAQEVNWRLLRQIAAKMKSTRVVLLGLTLAHELFGASLPDSVLDEVRRDPRVRNLAEKVCEQFAGNADLGAGVWSRAQFRIAASDGILPGLRHTLRLALSPTESDRRMVHLPGFFAPLSVFMRPLRLLRQYGLHSTLRPQQNFEAENPKSLEIEADAQSGTGQNRETPASRDE